MTMTTMMMTTTTRMIITIIRTTMTKRLTQLWDLIEARGFREDIKDKSNYDDDDDDNDNDNNDEKNNNNIEVEGISALALYRDLVFSRGYQEHQ